MGGGGVILVDVLLSVPVVECFIVAGGDKAKHMVQFFYVVCPCLSLRE